MSRPSRSSGMGYQIRIEGGGAVKKPHGRPECHAGSVLREREVGHEPHGRPVCQAGSVFGGRRAGAEPHGRPVCQAGSVFGGRRAGAEPHGRPVCQAGSVLGGRRAGAEPHGRPVCQAGSVLGGRRAGAEPHGRPVCQAGSVLGGIEGRQKNPTVVQCVRPDPYERGERGGRRTPRSSSMPGWIRMNGERGAERTRCPRSSGVGYRVRI